MITLELGHIQDVSGLPIVPLGHIELYLSGDATIIAPPQGQVLGGVVNAFTFYFDAACDLIGTPQIWSNTELYPQNEDGLGTWYIANFYDANGARLNNAPMRWAFPNLIGSTVDISTMTQISGSLIYYPSPYITEIGVPFSGITSGTNTQAAMVVGSGATLEATGTGVINATQLNGIPNFFNLTAGEAIDVGEVIVLTDGLGYVGTFTDANIIGVSTTAAAVGGVFTIVQATALNDMGYGFPVPWAVL